MRAFLAVVVSVAVMSCDGHEPALGSVGGVDEATEHSNITPPPSPESTPTGVETSGAAPSPCEDFSLRYLGQGLSTTLPADESATHGESTADLGPIHAGWAVEFELTDGSVTIGRRVGTTIVPEPNVSQRVVGDVVVFVKSDREPLRACILEAATYDRTLDEEDG